MECMAALWFTSIVTAVNANTTSDGDSGAEIVNITIGELAKNTDGSLDTLKDLLGR